MKQFTTRTAMLGRVLLVLSAILALTAIAAHAEHSAYGKNLHWPDEPVRVCVQDNLPVATTLARWNNATGSTPRLVQSCRNPHVTVMESDLEDSAHRGITRLSWSEPENELIEAVVMIDPVQYCLHATLDHEFGHVLGAGHGGTESSLMYHSGCGDDLRIHTADMIVRNHGGNLAPNTEPEPTPEPTPELSPAEILREALRTLLDGLSTVWDWIAERL